MWGRSKDKRVPSSAAQSASMKAVLQIQSFLLTVASISSYLPQTEALLRQKKKNRLLNMSSTNLNAGVS